LNFAIHFFVDIFVKTYIIMTNKEKYEMWGKVAIAMAEEKRIIQEVGVERAKTEYGIKFAKLREPRVSENK
jgi:hypothetical protein